MPSSLGVMIMPISTNRSISISMCSAWASSMKISPPQMPTAAMYVAACTRSDTTRCETGRSDDESTPSIRSVDVPTPVIWAPISPSNAHRSPISGSRAALSITVSPFATTAAMRMFSGRADARVRERDVRAEQHVGSRLHVAVGELERRSHRLEPAQVHVDRP